MYPLTHNYPLQYTVTARVISWVMLVYNNPRVPFGINMLVGKARFLLFYS